MGHVLVGGPYLGPPLTTQCEGDQCVDVGFGELAMSGGPELDESPQEEGTPG